MHWIQDYQLFLFDFDGLLVNTEEIHYLAYKRMCAQRGVNFDWDFESYCRVAHYSATGLKEKMYKQYPKLFEQEPSWNVLYSEKKQAIIDLIKEGAVRLMPGAESLLLALHDANIPRCVVTHSPDELVSVIREQNPVLNTIPSWFTREHYAQPKPHPESYLKAIETLAAPEDKVIGFEDTPRGLTALMGTRATPVLICEINYPEIPDFVAQGVFHFPTLDSLPKDRLPKKDN